MSSYDIVDDSAMHYIRVYTLFDISKTGTQQFKQSELPFTDDTGERILSYDDWLQSRHRQTNYDTILQVLSLRTQLFDVTEPEDVLIVPSEVGLGEMYNSRVKVWTFVFSYEHTDVFLKGDDKTGVLKEDCAHVPMFVDLDEDEVIMPYLVTEGAEQNLSFVVTNK